MPNRQIKFGAAFTFTLIIGNIFSNLSNAQDVDIQSWNDLRISWNIKPGMLIRSDFRYDRLLNEQLGWRKFSIQPLFEYYPSNKIDLYGGAFFSDTKQNDIDNTNEIRPIIGVRYNLTPERRVFIRGQAQYEHRFFKSKNEDTWNNISRFRTELKALISFTKKKHYQDKNLYGISRTIVFTNFEDNSIRERYKGRFRQYLGLGYRLSYQWRFELNYVYQASGNSTENDTPDEITHVLYTSVKYYFE